MLPVSMPECDLSEEALTQLQENAQKLSMKALTIEELKRELEQTRETE